MALVDHYSQSIGNDLCLTGVPGEDSMRRKKIVDTSSKYRPSISNEDQVVSNPFEFRNDMRRKHDRHAIFCAVTHELTKEVSSGDWVKARKRFVED